MDKKRKKHNDEIAEKLMFALILLGWVMIIMFISGIAGFGLFFLTGNLIKGMMFSSFVTFIFLLLFPYGLFSKNNEKKTTRSNSRRRR